MAAKKSDKENAGGSPRNAPMSREEVLRLSSRIHEVADAVGAMAVVMEDQALNEVSVDGYSKQERGLITLKEFLANLRQAIERASIR